MAQHGYLSDDNWTGSDRDPDYDRERAENRWRSERDRDWQSDSDHGRSFVSHERGDRWGGSPRRNERDDEGMFERWGDRARSWFSDDDDDHRRWGGERGGSDEREWFGGRSALSERNRGMSGYRGEDRDYGGSASGRGGFGASGQGYSANRDDHYRSWRDKQMQALDRDYQDYCREREQQFHSDFDTWRGNRQQNRGRLRAEQGSGADEQMFTPETTAVGNTMTTSETHEPQTTTEPERTVTPGTRNRR